MSHLQSHLQIGSPSVRLHPKLEWAPTRIIQERSQHSCAGQTGPRCPLDQKRMSVEAQGKVTCDLFLVERSLSCQCHMYSGQDMEPFRTRYTYTFTYTFTFTPSFERTLVHRRLTTFFLTFPRIALVRVHLRSGSVQGCTSYTRPGVHSSTDQTHAVASTSIQRTPKPEKTWPQI